MFRKFCFKAIIVGTFAVFWVFPSAAHAEQRGQEARAVFAGGCFWCLEPPFDQLKGVLSTTAGYMGGTKKNPTYRNVSSGKSGHVEAIEVVYDSSQITYPQLLDVFWMNIDPTTLNRQFTDSGTQYRTVIYYGNQKEKQWALASKEKLEKSGKFNKPIVTKVVPLSKFYKAEEYHQDFYKKNPARYKAYSDGSGRPRFLKKIWGR